MPWFCCDDCGDTIKKPKIAAHCCRCSAYSFTCIDCSRVFTQSTVNQHTSCVTEHEKYALGATKPGGFAESGFYNGNGNDSIKSQQKPGTNNNAPSGLEFLTTRPPWKCTICNVNCTSEETLHGHAAGAKHKRRARAALAAKQKEEGTNGNGGKEEEEEKKSSDVMKAKTEEKKEKNKDGKIKWKKLAVKELKKQGGSLKLKNLKAALLQAANVDDEPEEMMKKLAKCDKLVIEGKMVRLSSE